MRTILVYAAKSIWILLYLIPIVTGCKKEDDNPVNSQTPLVAKMNVSASSGEAPITITYTDISTGNITSRQWDLDDGSSAFASYLERTYTQAGRYWVRLTVTGPAGSASVTEIANITAPQPRVTLSDMTWTANNQTQTVTLTVDAAFRNYANQPRVLGLFWVRSSGSNYVFQTSGCSTNAPAQTLGHLRVLSPASSDETFNDVGATCAYSCFPVRTAGTTYYGYAVVYDRTSIGAVTSVVDPSLAQIGPPSLVVQITWQ